MGIRRGINIGSFGGGLIPFEQQDLNKIKSQQSMGASQSQIYWHSSWIKADSG